MSADAFPPLVLDDWRVTRNALHVYTRVFGKVRQALAPREKHWPHVTLHASATGLFTPAFDVRGVSFELHLDLTTQRLTIANSLGGVWQQPLAGQAAAKFCDQVVSALGTMGVEVAIDRSLFEDETPFDYDAAAASRFWSALARIDATFKRFRATLREESGPVQFWPHHFDLAMLWFSGRKVPGVDPNDEENADEHMNFGFSTGDSAVPEPYFFITAYPLPDGFLQVDLPKDAHWHQSGFTGALLHYRSLLGCADPEEKLLRFLETLQRAGAGAWEG